MFVVNDDLSIYATRGDIVCLNVSATDDSTENDYEFQPGDIVRMKIFAKKDAESVVMQKDFPVVAKTFAVGVYLTEDDTKIGDVISKPTDYWYEIELNPYTNPQTIVGYDEDGAKIFKLFPEGKDLHTDEPTKPEDVPVVDEDLSLTSSRPVENKAISRAITLLKNDLAMVDERLTGKIKENKDTNKDLAEQVVVERARIDNLIASPVADDAELIDIRVGADGVAYASAGTAVRTQVNSVLDEVQNVRGELAGCVVLTEGDAKGYYDADGRKDGAYTYIHLAQTERATRLLRIDFELLLKPDICAVWYVADGELIGINEPGVYSLDVSQASDVYINFFGERYAESYTLVFEKVASYEAEEKVSEIYHDTKNVLTAINGAEVLTVGEQSGYFVEGELVAYQSFTCSHIDLTTFLVPPVRIEFTMLRSSDIPSLYYVVDGTFHEVKQAGTFSVDISDATDLYINFFGENYVTEYKLVYDFHGNSVSEEVSMMYSCKLSNVVAKPFDFNGKSGVFFGDSITQGYIDDGSTVTQNGYPKLFCDRVGMTFSSNGVAGSCFTDGVKDVENILGKIRTVGLGDYDFLFVAGGINDCLSDVPVKDFENAVIECFNYISSNYNGEVIVIAPINSVHEKAVANLDKYRNVLGEQSILHGFNFVDGGKFNFPKERGALADYLFGGTALIHPSEKGYQLYANALGTALC